MPIPWKKARLGGLSRLLVSSLRFKAQRGVGDSALVVQAGFPTSVADLVLKNRSRLRKPARWRRNPAASATSPGCSTMATLTSEIIAAASAADRLPAPPRSPPPEADERRQRCPEPLRGVLGSEAEKDGFLEASAPSGPPKAHTLESSPTVAARRGEACGAQCLPEEAERKVLGGGTSGGLMVVAKVAFLMVILAVVSKKIAVAVSISAFGFLFAESIGRRLIPWLAPCEEAKKSLGAIVGGGVPVSDLIQTPEESNSHGIGGIPLLLVRISELDLGSFHSERDWIVETPAIAAASAGETTSPAFGEKDCAEIKGGRGDHEASNANRKKKKKLFGSFVPVKFRVFKGVKAGKIEGKLEPASNSGGGEAPGRKCIEEEALEEEEEEEEDEDEDDDRGVDDENEDGGGGEEGLGLQIPAMAHGVGLEDAACVGGNVGELAKGSSGHLVFFVIVLSGLVGGRVVALVLTVLWYSLVSSARSLWRSWNSHRSLEAVPDASISEALGTGGG